MKKRTKNIKAYVSGRLADDGTAIVTRHYVNEGEGFVGIKALPSLELAQKAAEMDYSASIFKDNKYKRAVFELALVAVEKEEKK